MTRIAYGLTALAVLAGANTAGAQTISVSPAAPSRWDAGGSVGWFGGNEESTLNDWDDWYDAGTGSLEVGRYWGTHLKTEVSLSTSSEGETYSQTQVPGGTTFPLYRFTRHFFQTTQLAGSAVYQFGENSWVHPFAGGGVLVNWEEERREIQDPRLSPVVENYRTTVVRPFVTGGFKFYVHERAYIRTDVQAAFRPKGMEQLTWRGGVGFDF